MSYTRLGKVDVLLSVARAAHRLSHIAFGPAASRGSLRRSKDDLAARGHCDFFCGIHGSGATCLSSAVA